MVPLLLSAGTHGASHGSHGTGLSGFCTAGRRTHTRSQEQAQDDASHTGYDALSSPTCSGPPPCSPDTHSGPSPGPLFFLLSISARCKTCGCPPGYTGGRKGSPGLSWFQTQIGALLNTGRPPHVEGVRYGKYIYPWTASPSGCLYLLAQVLL